MSSFLLEPTRLTVQVGSVEREALVIEPAGVAGKLAAVIVLHGHGGTAKSAIQSFAVHKHWPDALTIYPQGLPTATQRDPEGKRSGWQARDLKDENRDVAFLKALIEKLTKDYPVDDKRIYLMGHSNGGGMTYYLTSKMPTLFAAIAPSGSSNGVLVRSQVKIPVFHVAGMKDPIVPFDNQKAMLDKLAAFLEVSQDTNSDEFYTTRKSASGIELATYIHPGRHDFPAKSMPHIVEFFKRHVRQ